MPISQGVGQPKHSLIYALVTDVQIMGPLHTWSPVAAGIVAFKAVSGNGENEYSENDNHIHKCFLDIPAKLTENIFILQGFCLHCLKYICLVGRVRNIGLIIQRRFLKCREQETGNGHK